MGDLIDRQAAIDALNEYFARIGKLKRSGMTKGEKAISLDTVRSIEMLPSAQPEIIRCKDCKHWDTSWQKDDAPNYHFCPMLGMMREGDFYCADAERRTDG